MKRLLIFLMLFLIVFQFSSCSNFSDSSSLSSTNSDTSDTKGSGDLDDTTDSDDTSLDSGTNDTTSSSDDTSDTTNPSGSEDIPSDKNPASIKESYYITIDGGKFLGEHPKDVKMNTAFGRTYAYYRFICSYEEFSSLSENASKFLPEIFNEYYVLFVSRNYSKNYINRIGFRNLLFEGDYELNITLDRGEYDYVYIDSLCEDYILIPKAEFRDDMGTEGTIVICENHKIPNNSNKIDVDDRYEGPDHYFTIDVGDYLGKIPSLEAGNPYYKTFGYYKLISSYEELLSLAEKAENVDAQIFDDYCVLFIARYYGARYGNGIGFKHFNTDYGKVQITYDRITGDFWASDVMTMEEDFILIPKSDMLGLRIEEDGEIEVWEVHATTSQDYTNFRDYYLTIDAGKFLGHIPDILIQNIYSVTFAYYKIIYSYDELLSLAENAAEIDESLFDNYYVLFISRHYGNIYGGDIGFRYFDIINGELYITFDRYLEELITPFEVTEQDYILIEKWTTLSDVEPEGIIYVYETKVEQNSRTPNASIKDVLDDGEEYYETIDAGEYLGGIEKESGYYRLFYSYEQFKMLTTKGYLFDKELFDEYYVLFISSYDSVINYKDLGFKNFKIINGKVYLVFDRHKYYDWGGGSGSHYREDYILIPKAKLNEDVEATGKIKIFENNVIVKNVTINDIYDNSEGRYESIDGGRFLGRTSFGGSRHADPYPFSIGTTYGYYRLISSYEEFLSLAQNASSFEADIFDEYYVLYIVRTYDSNNNTKYRGFKNFTIIDGELFIVFDYFQFENGRLFERLQDYVLIPKSKFSDDINKEGAITIFDHRSA